MFLRIEMHFHVVCQLRNLRVSCRCSFLSSPTLDQKESRSTFFHEITFVCDAADTNQALHDALAEYASVQPTAYIAPADAPDVLQPASE